MKSLFLFVCGVFFMLNSTGCVDIKIESPKAAIETVTHVATMQTAGFDSTTGMQVFMTLMIAGMIYNVIKTARGKGQPYDPTIPVGSKLFGNMKGKHPVLGNILRKGVSLIGNAAKFLPIPAAGKIGDIVQGIGDKMQANAAARNANTKSYDEVHAENEAATEGRGNDDEDTGSGSGNSSGSGSGSGSGSSSNNSFTDTLKDFYTKNKTMVWVVVGVLTAGIGLLIWKPWKKGGKLR